MSTTATKIDFQEGTWTVDPAHSSANFEVEHAGVSVFRGGFKPVDAKLIVSDSGLELEGAVDVASITIDDENIRPHVLSPDFFDADRNPGIEYRSTEVTGDADDLRVTGELSMAGVSLPVTARGRLRGPIDLPDGHGQKLSIALETAIDRTDFGMDWQMELPSGGPVLANEVSLRIELEFNRS